jgi:cob(I)alamin adenosyltransferase
MKIYTRTGDEGDTGLFGGGRVPKSHRRVEAYGAVDELNAALGVCREVVSDAEIQNRLIRIQKDLFVLGSSLATPGAEDGSARPSTPPVPVARVQEMEGWIDEATDEVPELRNFILPGGTQGSAFLHLARTICRRAERAVVRLSMDEGVDPVVLQYLNRLSDVLFALGRLENGRAGVADVLWAGDNE